MPKRKRDRNPAQIADGPPAPSVTESNAAPGPSFEFRPQGSAVDPADPALADALALFAERHHAEREAEQQAKRAKQAAVRRGTDLERLRKAKDEAVAHLKAVRRQERVAPGEAEAAEAAYTAAAADLVALETGERPSWAPAMPEPPDPEPSGEADDLATADSGDQPNEPSSPVDP